MTVCLFWHRGSWFFRKLPCGTKQYCSMSTPRVEGVKHSTHQGWVCYNWWEYLLKLLHKQTMVTLTWILFESRLLLWVYFHKMSFLLFYLFICILPSSHTSIIRCIGQSSWEKFPLTFIVIIGMSYSTVCHKHWLFCSKVLRFKNVFIM